MQKGPVPEEEFLEKDLRQEWFSVRVWNHCISLNLKTVQDLVNIFSLKDFKEQLGQFGGRSKNEVFGFFEKHNIVLQSSNQKINLRKIIVKRTLCVN
jgi:hypothetical protein